MRSQEQEAYDSWHSKLTINTSADEIWHKKLVEHASLSDDFANKQVLEIGCGRGGFAIWLASQEFSPKQITAADFSDAAVLQLKQAVAVLGIKNIYADVQDITAINYPDACFDTVISCETIEHVPIPSKAIRELARVLKPGGRLLLTTPNYMNFFGLWRGYRRVIGRPYTEAGQPINKFVMLPVTLYWIKRAQLEVEAFGSEQFLLPRFRSPPRHLNPPNLFRPMLKYFGLQSWVVARKPI